MPDILSLICPRCGLQADIEIQDNSFRSPLSSIKNGDVTTQHTHLNVRKIVRCVNNHRYALDGEITIWRRN